MSLALVTGASGWLGQNLVRALLHGIPGDPLFGATPEPRPVRCLVQPGDPARALERFGDRIQRVAGDVCDPASLQAFFADAEGATLFHLVGVVHPRRAADFTRINVEGTRHVLERARNAGVRRFVHVSSTAAMGVSPGPGLLLDESSPPRPWPGYGESKLAAEELVRAAHGHGLECVIVRPPWFFGPGQPARQGRFFRMVRRGLAPQAGRGDALRSVVFVDHLCQALLLCEQVGRAAGRTYCVADAEPLRWSELLETIRQVLAGDFGLQAPRRHLPLPPGAPAAARVAGEALLRKGFYNQNLSVAGELDQTIACRIDRAREELGYRPHLSFAEVVRRSVEWMQAEGETL